MGNPMQEARAALAQHPTCGAYARTTGQPCKNSSMPNGRCRMHGGNAGRKPTHGRYTKAAKAERREVRVLLRAIRELIGEA
jgi:hypothetical protein